MKKILLSCGLATMLLANNASAQVIFSEDFESTTGTALPAGWNQTNVGATLWKTGTNTTLQSTDFQIEAHTRMIGFNDDAAGSTALNPDQLLTTPVIDFTTATAPAIRLDLFYFAGTYQTIAESFKIEVSTNGGTNWTVVETVAGNTVSPWQTRYIQLPALAGQANCKIGFRYSDNNGFLFGVMMDNMTVFNQAANDGAVASINFPKIAVTNTALPVTVFNVGTAPITTLDMNYKVDGGTPVTQQFTGLNIAPLTSAVVTFTTTVAATVGAHTLDVAITQVNGATDVNTGDNTGNSNFMIASATTVRNGLIEEFSSSTCPPCASFNAAFDPLVSTTPVNANQVLSHFNVIKYQMNWPSPNNDRSYNAHGASRQAYYGVSGIPDHYTNGAAGGAGDIGEINTSKAGPAFVDISGTYIIHNNNTFDITYSVTPHFTITGNYRIHVATVQRAFDLDVNDPSQTTTQTHFVFAMRKMFPDGSGTTAASLTDGTALTGSWMAQPFATTYNPQQGNFEFWSHPMASDVVVFIQDNTTGEVLQSQVITAQWPTDVANIANDTKVLLFPNPASDQAVLSLNMENAATVNMVVTDAVGRVVYTRTSELSAGRHDLPINTSSYAAGVYNVTIKTEKGSLTERLTIAK
jgi:hypothetical protein